MLIYYRKKAEEYGIDILPEMAKNVVFLKMDAKII